MTRPLLRRSSLTSIRVRLILPSLLAVGSLSVLVFYNGFEARKGEARRTRENTQQLARLAEASEERLIEAAEHLLVGLAQPPPVCGNGASSCSKTFAALVKQYPRYLNIGAADAAGNIIASDVHLSGPVNAFRSAWFEHAVQNRNLAIGEYQIGELTAKYALLLGYPAFDSSGKVKFVWSDGPTSLFCALCGATNWILEQRNAPRLSR